MKKYAKLIALGCVLLAMLTLSGCYVPQDEITDTGLNTQGELPFATFSPTPSPTPVPEATPTPTRVPAATPTPTQDLSTWQPSGPATTRPGATVQIITPQPSKATAAPTSLKNGATGSQVRRVQQRLKELGYYSGSVDGDFGSGTENAVRAFQKANGLTVDGKVGTQTLEKLNSSSAKKATVTAAPANVTKAPAATSVPKTDIYLELGSSGSGVTRLQRRLIELGYLDGKADGSYGGATEYAVRAFQNNKSGLWTDGKAGPDTLKAIYGSNPPKASAPVSSIGYTLELGSSGSAVRALQKRLKELGYYTGSVDGSFGASTEDAVKTFQGRNGLTTDGKAGTATLNTLYSSNAAKVGSSVIVNAAGTTVVASTGFTTLEQGVQGEQVKNLQQKLKNLGFYAGKVDGSYGMGTVSAVLAFQQATGLEADGKAGPATQRMLFSTGNAITYATISPGESGSAVTNLQHTLYELGYYHNTIDGVYGDSTKAAVLAFQKRNKLTPADGVAGGKTLQRLYSSSAKPAATSTSTYKKLQLGDIGEDVLEMKDVLLQLGYPATRDSNAFDEQTRQAVLLFQRYNGLTQDGIAGPDTQARLYSDNPIANPNR